MHLKPEPIFTLDESHVLYEIPPKIPSEVTMLISDGIFKVPENFTGSWRQLVATPEVAKWAYTVAVDAMQWLTSAANDVIVRERLEFQTQDLPEIGKNAG